MSKLPFFQFYSADWIQDTRALSLPARGFWIDLICQLWIAPERGKISWGISNVENLAGMSELETCGLLNELKDAGVAEIKFIERANNEQLVTVICRRIVREEKIRKQTLERVKRFRNGDVTQMKRRIYQKSEVRSHINTKTVLLRSSTSENQKKTSGFSDWPDEDEWLKQLISEQVWLNGRRAALEDFSWWEAVAKEINGIQPEFIQPEFAKMSAWLKENPARMPTTKGIKRFVRRWLERGRESERRKHGNQR